MARKVFRVCREVYARLDGEGSRRVGGRWNTPGRSVVYLAESISLAVLEILVHMSRQDFPLGYVCIAAKIPDDVPILMLADLQGSCASERTQELGDYWFDGKLSPVLRVPSVVVPSEFNYLLNPLHARFIEIVVDPPVPFHFDERLFIRGARSASQSLPR
jgi:RES domain-containing protein